LTTFNAETASQAETLKISARSAAYALMSSHQTLEPNGFAASRPPADNHP